MDINSFLETHLPTIEGWCEKDKALKLYDIIREVKPDLCVEIGVFGGSSFIPQALALKHNNKGTIAGIDPWSNNSAIEEMENFANKNWWGQVDLQGVYDRFLNKQTHFMTITHLACKRKISDESLGTKLQALLLSPCSFQEISYQDLNMRFPAKLCEALKIFLIMT